MNLRLRGRRVGFAALALVAGGTALASPDDEIEVPDAAEACLSCHAFEPGGPELEGPTLWQVFGRPIASIDDYPYSQALRAQQGSWDRATLDRFLTSPQQFAPGLNMTLGGVRNAADRAIVIDFLEKLGSAAASSAAAPEPKDGP
jgi:cytochrome c